MHTITQIKNLLGWVLKKVQKMFGYKKSMIRVEGKKEKRKVLGYYID